MMEDGELRQLLPIEIRPEVTMLSVLRHLNYKAWYAIAEFIDNSLQSSIANEEQLNALHGGKFQLKVDIKIEASGLGQIIISDNAAGIAESDFPRAFRAAQVPADRSGLSEFGMGMKSAACWFAQTWSVRTKAINESVERSIFFDIQNIVENKIESLDTAIRDVDAAAHYTVVSLRGLHHLPHGRTIGKIRDHLASIYRVFLRDGRLQLSLNGTPLNYQSPRVLHSVKYVLPGVQASGENAEVLEWKKYIDLDFGGSQRVTGFVALREVGSISLAGFSLFRRDRLIEGSFDEAYRPSYVFKQANSYPYQRLFGELHIEGFEVSHTKDGFRWEEFEDIFLEQLKAEVERPPLDLLAQAENYRALPVKKNIEIQAVAATNTVAEYIEKDVAPLLVEAQQNPTVAEEIPAELPSSSLQASERTVEIDDGSYQWVITLRTSVDPSTEDWVSLARTELPTDNGEQIRRLILDLSLAHPFSVKFLGANNENVELLLRISTAVCISLILSQDVSGDPPENFLGHFNYLMRGAIRGASFNN